MIPALYGAAGIPRSARFHPRLIAMAHNTLRPASSPQLAMPLADSAVYPARLIRTAMLSATSPNSHTHEENFREEILARGHIRISAGAAVA
jgi:hypothetical protein